MSNRRTKGSHTWEQYLDYHCCPECGRVFESRQPYEYRMGKRQKDATCPRCQYQFKVTKNVQPSFGPLMG